MKFWLMAIAATLPSLSVVGATVADTSPYSGQEQREIKALSEPQIAGLLAGRGLGYAKAAELNGYPGPMHVLELADELELDADQRKATQQLFDEMLVAAKEHGAELVEAERRLDQAFKSREVDEASVAELTRRIGVIEARLRAVHLTAHLRQTHVLSAEQTARYMSLRGYSNTPHGANQHLHHH